MSFIDKSKTQTNVTYAFAFFPKPFYSDNIFFIIIIEGKKIISTDSWTNMLMS